MNIEELSKAQLLLLTVMVNFVVSIATGVLTVSLLDQAPVTISQGVEHVVDHTIQTIAAPSVQVTSPIRTVVSAVTSPITGLTAAPAAAPTPEPSQEDRMTSAIAAAGVRTVLLYRTSTTSPAIAFGTYLPSAHAVATVLSQGLPKQLLIGFADGSSAKASLSRSGTGVAIYGFADDEVLPKAPDAGLTAASTLKQGQSVVALTKDSAAVTGIISKVDASTIQTNLEGVPAGAGIVDLSGLVIGIASSAVGAVIPADVLSALLSSEAK